MSNKKLKQNSNENVIVDENTLCLFPNQINYAHIILLVRLYLQKYIDDVNKRTNQKITFDARPETNQKIIEFYEAGKKVRPDFNDAELCCLVVETIKRIYEQNTKQCA